MENKIKMILKSYIDKLENDAEYLQHIVNIKEDEYMSGQMMAKVDICSELQEIYNLLWKNEE